MVTTIIANERHIFFTRAGDNSIIQKGVLLMKIIPLLSLLSVGAVAITAAAVSRRRQRFVPMPIRH